MNFTKKITTAFIAGLLSIAVSAESETAFSNDTLGTFIEHIESPKIDSFTTELIATDKVPLIDGLNKRKLKNGLTDSQLELLRLAYSIAKEDGHHSPQLLQGIIIQESNAGLGLKYARPGAPFYGVAQIKVEATRDVLASYPELIQEFNLKNSSSGEIIRKLKGDDAFNLSVASKYLLIMQRYGYKTIKQLALAYNQGPGGAKRKNSDTHHYSVGVDKHIRALGANTQIK